MRLRFTHILAVILFIGMGLNTLAQNLTKAEKLIEQNRFADAAKVLEKKTKKSPENPALNEQLGFAYMKLHEFTKAEISFAKADLIGGLSSSGLIHYGQVLIKNQKTPDAVRIFERYIATEPDNFIAQLMLRSITEVKRWKSVPSAFELKPLIDLNSNFSDFSPIPFKNGIVFATERNVDFVNESSSGYNNAPFLATYFAESDKKAPEGFSFDRAKPFLSNLNQDYHTGPVSIDTVHQKILYTVAQSNLGRKKENKIDVYIADLIGDKRIKNERALLGKTSFNLAHASFSPDGNAILFSSDMEGGQGGMDLYIISKSDSGWSQPQNLSSDINTPLNEVFPYFKNESTIYFASNGHAGYGGLDLFITEKVGGVWMKPENLKSPINSSKDDFGICFVNETKGYFSSARDGGAGKDDIYGFIKLSELNDTQRVEISGIFEYKNLPPEGVTLSLLDEFDNVLGTVRTDSNGNFTFTSLPVGANYTIRLDEEDSDMLLNSNIFIVNDEGEKVQILERENAASFVFKTLPKEEINRMAMLIDEDTSIETYDLFGQLFQKLGADIANIELIAYGPEGDILASTFTNENGYYQFTNLPKDTYATIRIASNDSVIYRSSVFYADEFGTEKLDTFKNEFFQINFSPEPEDTANSDRKAAYTGFLVYNDKPLAGIPIVIFDSALKISEVVRTSNQGSFELYSTHVKSNYRLILPDSFIAKRDTCEIYLVDKATNKLIYANYLDFRSYDFTTLPSIEEQLNKEELEFLQQPLAISGKVYEKLPGDYSGGLNIYAYDEEGNLIETVITDANGDFKFTKLRPDKVYSIVPDMTKEGSFKMIVRNDDYGTSDTLRLADLQSYVYEKLESERLSRLESIEEHDFKMPGLDKSISGQIYNKLPGDYKEGIKIYAFDDNGNIIDSTYTDGKGGFVFNRIGSIEDFSIKVIDENDQDLKVALFNYDGSFKGLLFLDQNNSFQYSKIILEAASELETDYMQDESQGILYGQIFKQLPGDYKKGMSVYAFDDKGNVIDAAKMDDNGNFQFKKLRGDKEYVFRLDESDTDFNIALLDANGNIIDKDKGVDGEWTFGKIQYDRYNLKRITTDDSEMSFVDQTASEANQLDEPEKTVEIPKTEPKPTPKVAYNGDKLVFNFDFRIAAIKEEDKSRLDAIITSFKADPSQIVAIESHSGVDEKEGQRTFSAMRTASIARYLYEAGVPVENMQVSNWETTNPRVTCENNTCSEAEKALNRSSDVTLLPAEAAKSKPNYVFNYGFNQWRLSDESEKIAYQLIKEAKNNPNATIQIDGYTDTWGSFESNSRISELRSINIKNLLILKGISPDRISMDYHGEMKPSGHCILYYPCPVDYRSQNRRTEVRMQ